MGGGGGGSSWVREFGSCFFDGGEAGKQACVYIGVRIVLARKTKKLFILEAFSF